MSRLLLSVSQASAAPRAQIAQSDAKSASGPQRPPPTNNNNNNNNDEDDSWSVRDAAACAAVAAAASAAFVLSRFRVCKADQIIVKTGALINKTWTGRRTVVWPVIQRHVVVPLSPSTINVVLTAMSKEFLQADLPIDVVVRPADPYKNAEGFELFCQNLGNGDERQLKAVVLAALEGKLRAIVAQRELVDVFNDARAECNSMLEDHVRHTLSMLGVDVVSVSIRSMDDENGFFGAHRTRATEGAVLSSDADVAQRRCVSVLAQEEEKRKQASGVAELTQKRLTVEAEQKQIATINANAQAMKIAESEMQLAVMKAEARRKSQTADVDATAAVREQAAVRDAQVQAKEREAAEQRLRATDLAKVNIRVEAQQREADGDAYAVRARAEAQAAAIRAIAQAERDQALMKAEGKRAELAAEADGYAKLLDAYNSNPELAKFVKGNESGLWAKQAEQGAAALQNLKPTYHVWQSGPSTNKDPLLSLAEQVMPLAHMVGAKMLPNPQQTLTDVLNAFNHQKPEA